MSDEWYSELHILKLKYKQLFAKSENFCMTAAHWKAHYNQTLQLQVPMTEATCKNMTEQLMNNIVHSEDVLVSHNWKHLSSCNKFQCHLADSMWCDKHECFVLLQEFFLEHTITLIWKEVYSPANVLHAIDMAGGRLSIEGMEVLCTCETKSAK